MNILDDEYNDPKLLLRRLASVFKKAPTERPDSYVLMAVRVLRFFGRTPRAAALLKEAQLQGILEGPDDITDPHYALDVSPRSMN